MESNLNFLDISTINVTRRKFSRLSILNVTKQFVNLIYFLLILLKKFESNEYFINERFLEWD